MPTRRNLLAGFSVSTTDRPRGVASIFCPPLKASTVRVSMPAVISPYEKQLPTKSLHACASLFVIVGAVYSPGEYSRLLPAAPPLPMLALGTDSTREHHPAATRWRWRSRRAVQAAWERA